MKLKKIGQTVTPFNAIEVLLKNRGVQEQDIKYILNPTKECELDYEYRNMNEAVKITKTALKNNSKIGIVCDCDVDGVTSTAVLYMFLKEIKLELDIKIYTHSAKTHGLSNEIMKEVLEDNPSILFTPDSASGDFEQHKILKDNNICCIVLDHHDCIGYSEDAIVVNNLMEDGGNKTLTGVGMVYKFIEKINKTKAKKYLDLVALGQVADMSNCTNLETRYLVYKGIELINKGKYSSNFLKELVKLRLEAKPVSIIGLGFYIAPYINSTIRMADKDVMDKLINSFVDNSKDSFEEELNLCKGCKETQNLMAEEGYLELVEQIEKCNLDRFSVLICNGERIFPSIKGLVANKIASKFGKPTLVLSEKNGILKGSGRGSKESSIQNFKNFLSMFPYNSILEGHGNAFGYGVRVEDIGKLYDFISTVPYEKVEREINVDDIFEINNLPVDLIKTVASYDDIWGNSLTEPQFAITDIHLNSNDIQIMGKQSDTIKFIYNGVDYLIFKADKDLKDKLMNVLASKNTITVVGKFKINEFRGVKKPQIQIAEIEID